MTRPTTFILYFYNTISVKTKKKADGMGFFFMFIKKQMEIGIDDGSLNPLEKGKSYT
jgi:hypothetical protein